MKPLKKITIEDAHFYKPLDMNELSPDVVCRKATAFTLTPDPAMPGWEYVNYYQDSPFDQSGKLVIFRLLVGQKSKRNFRSNRCSYTLDTNLFI